MLGLVSRERLLACERSRVDLKVEKIRLETRLAEAEGAMRTLQAGLDLALRQIEMLETDRNRLVEALATRKAPAAEQA